MKHCTSHSKILADTVSSLFLLILIFCSVTLKICFRSASKLLYGNCPKKLVCGYWQAENFI